MIARMLMKNKNKLRESVRSRYTKIPNELLALGLRSEEIGLATFLMSLPEEFDPSVSYLAEKFSASKSTIKRWMDHLVKTNVVSILSSGDFKKKKVKRYQFEPKNKWRKHEARGSK